MSDEQVKRYKFTDVPWFPGMPQPTYVDAADHDRIVSALRAEKQMSDERRELIKTLAVASYGHQTRPQYRATWIQEIISDADTILAALAATEKKP